MPILPLDHPEPFAASLGVMLYPGTNEEDQRNARAFAGRWLAEPFRRFHEAGHKISYDALASILMDLGAQLRDLNECWWGGMATGDLFKALFILAKDAPPLASWENAIKVYVVSAQRAGLRGSRTDLREAIRRFRSVAHLWGAWCIREGKLASASRSGTMVMPIFSDPRRSRDPT